MDFFGEYTGLYFYSAVFQGNMALLALTGVFLIFKLQQITTRINEAGEHMRLYVLRYMQKGQYDYSADAPSKYVAPEDYRRTLSTEIKKGGHAVEFNRHTQSLLDDNDFKRLEDELGRWKSRASEMQQAFLVPLSWSVTVVILSLVCMLLAYALHGIPALEMFVFLATVVLSIVVIVRTKCFIVASMRTT